MEIKVLVPFLLLLSFVQAQTTHYKSYDWRTSGNLQEWPKLDSLVPYQRPVASQNYPGPRDSTQYHRQPVPYVDSSIDNSYSSEYQKLPYVDQSLPSYEQYGHLRDDDFNMTKERIGGFAGTGDTRGYGAYDFPKNNHPEHGHEQVEHEEPESISEYSHLHSRHGAQSEISDLLRIGRNVRSRYPNPDPMLIHPLQPPL
ncbi:uncharacterized protein NPIL_432441 [Nephila pilipes]|uniref:Uncharacterized protein n=1 Tax=Nephila pilipes TaxID=299642 RepID=A0A8X6TVR8_NEPPI|nr:uncharacterized protein NPIL_432441 [Nephila pilipes]